MSLVTSLTILRTFRYVLATHKIELNYQNYTLFHLYQHFFYNQPHQMEREVHQSLNLSYNQQQIHQLEQQFINNKQLMFDILSKAPKVGVYKHQNKQHWQSFFKFYIDFLKSEQGPRGDCAKSIRQRLVADEETVNKLLTPFKLRSDMHIRQIYKKIKTYIPCVQYTQMKKIEEARQKFIENILRFGDESSPMVKHITEGLIKKHGENYDIKPHLEALKANYVQKLKEADQYLDKLRQVVEKCQGYFHLLAVEKYFESYFIEWKVADSEMGKQSCKTGSLFQQKVFNTMLPYIYYRQTHDKSWMYADKKLEVFQNLSWIPRNLGEIDIALGYKDEVQNRYFITTLIECKSRFFDLREAHRQVSLENEGAISKGPTFAELKAIKKIKLQQSKSKKKSEQKNEQNKKQNEQDKKQNEQKSVEPPTTLVVDHKKFLSTKYGPAELVQNHHFYIITTLPQNQFVLPIESKMKEGIEKYTRNMFLQDIQKHSQPLYLNLKERFQNLRSPLDWLQQYEAKWKGTESNILVLR